MQSLRSLWFRLDPRAHPVAPRRPTRVRRRSAAVAIVAGLLFTVAVQLGMGWAIDTERLPLRDPIYFDKLKLLRNHPALFQQATPGKPTTVLFVGSSRTLNAIDAGAASGQLTRQLGRPVETFNFGQAGAGPVTNAVYVRRLRQEGVKPNFVLIEVHPVFLAGQRPDPPETRWLLPIRLRPAELPVVREMGFPAATPAVHGRQGYIAPWFEYRFLIADRYAPFLIMQPSRLNGGHEPDANGFARLQERASPADRIGFLKIAWGQYAYYFDGFRPNGCGIGGVRDTLDQCREAGCKAALVLMPESTEWLGWYPPKGLRELDTVMAGLSKEYGVPVFDARKWVPDHLSVDGHHLTGQGADLLTEKLTREALAPWIAASPEPGRSP